MPILSTRGAGSARGFGFGGGKAAPVSFDYLVVAGGGGNGIYSSGGAGAGGYRTSFPGGTKITLDAGIYPITVGAGVTGNGPSPGTDSIFSTITSAAGGGGRGAGGSGG
jgi:hypothetical protein